MTLLLLSFYRKNTGKNHGNFGKKLVLSCQNWNFFQQFCQENTHLEKNTHFEKKIQIFLKIVSCFSPV